MTRELVESVLEILARTGLKIWFCLGPEKYTFDDNLYTLDRRSSPPEKVLRPGITPSPTDEYLIVSASKRNDAFKAEASIRPCCNRYLGWTFPARNSLPIKDVNGRPDGTEFNVWYNKNTIIIG